jgi:hypothetical protein
MRTAAVALAFLGPGVFVWLRSAALPPWVASHFSASGAADGFMPRSAYIALMAAIAVGKPSLVAAAARRVDVLAEQRVTLPNRGHWLAPSRRARTLAFVRLMSTAFAALLTLFLCFVHGLVARAQALHPARLRQCGLPRRPGVLGVATVLWAIVLLARFGHRPA